MFGKIWEMISRVLMKNYSKALTIGLNILNAIDGFLEDSEECSGEPFELFPIYIKRGGKKWTINVTIKCEKIQKN